jgi:N-acetylglucosaminyldiphosphoundecaprenol N-acetyl-beta-D-mannosaminyltransferase
MEDAIAQIESWVAHRERTHYVTFTNVHAVMQARSDESFKRVLEEADMVCPDGRPLVWVGRQSGASLDQVCGPDMMIEFIRATQTKPYSHFFYGGSPAVVEKLASELAERFPEVKIGGWYSPPFRDLTVDEEASVVRMINDISPDVLWVGLGCPKQERWMYKFRKRLTATVLLGVGQAFDIHAGTLRQSPRWFREHGLEWLFRFCLEPRRLWRRYLFYNTGFVCRLFMSSSDSMLRKVMNKIRTRDRPM